MDDHNDNNGQQLAIPFEAIVSRANDAVIVTDAMPIDEPGPRIIYVNQAFTDITGYQQDEVIGRSPRILQGPDTDPEVRARIRQALEQELPVREELINYTKQGKPYWLDLNIVPLRDAQGEVRFYAAIERDISSLKQQQQDLRELAIKDPLTGLLNRRGFAEYANNLIALAHRENQLMSLAVIDLDHFKQINDLHGHDAGDEVLRQLAEQMHQGFRQTDVLGRLGGEEFVVLLPGSDAVGSSMCLDNLRQQVANLPIQVSAELQLNVTFSAGIATLNDTINSVEDLTKLADEALYRAKDAGRDKVWHVDDDRPIA